MASAVAETGPRAGVRARGLEPPRGFAPAGPNPAASASSATPAGCEDSPVRKQILSTHAAFASFGAFWGAWAALLPAVQRHVGASKSQLGLALLCVAVGALPAMLATGAILDRAGRSLVGPSLLLFAAAIVAPGFASSLGGLALALVGVGVGSGVLDVAINAQASSLEAATERRLMPMAHALFSAGLVVASVSVGLARQ